MTVFKKAIIFTDIHYGYRSNCEKHLDDCSDFIDWIIREAKKHNAETCMFLGDWHDIRNAINIKTLNRSLDDLRKLNKAFEKVYFIIGNHDLFYRNSRELHSSPFLEDLENFVVIDDILQVEDCVFLPWLIEDEHKLMKNMKCKYVFSHLELPGFMMNAMVEMPDHGNIHAEDFVSPDYVFTGHFHKRHSKGKVTYIGNAFPHNYADAWDDERGYMLLEYGKDPEFYNWGAAPKYRTLKLSELLDKPENYIDDKTYARVSIDIDINFEEAQFIKETFQTQFNPRRIDFLHQHKSQEDDFEFAEGTGEFKSVDQIVSEGINNVDSQNIDKSLLMNIYKGLH